MEGRMTLPVTEVAVSFTTGPYDVPVWVPITSRSLKFTTQIGKQQSSDVVQPGTALVTVDNDDRRFDPLHAAGPYFGNLKPNKRIRIRASAIGTYDLFNGFVDGWPQTYQDQGSSRPVIPATDAFKFLARAQITKSAYRTDTASIDKPTLWFPLDETAGTVMANIGAFVNYVGPGTYSVDVGSPNGSASTGLAVAGIVAGDEPATAITDASSTWSGAIVCRPNAYISALSGWFATGKIGIELWVRQDQPVTTFLFTTPDLQQFIILNSAGSLGFGCDGFNCNSSGVSILDGQPHHLFFTYDIAAGSLKIYVDGVDRSGATTGTQSFSRSVTGTIHAGTGPAVTIQHFAIWQIVGGGSACPTPARIAARFALGAQPWAGDLTGTRVGRILDAAQWPAVDRNLNVGESVLGPAKQIAGSNALAYCQKLDRTEQGSFYVDHADGGKIRLRDRLDLLTATNSTTSVITFSDDPSDPNHYDAGGLDLVYDEQLVINEIVVTWDGGKITVSDAASITANGLHSVSVDSACGTALTATDLGNWLLTHYKDVFLRVRSLRIVPSSDPTLYDIALGLQLGWRITIRRLPQNIGAAIVIDAIIEGIEHQVDGDAGTWITTFSLSQAELQAYWIAGVSLAGIDTRAGY
jgi:hypothetical protein